jgi:hypothetical protein
MESGDGKTDPENKNRIVLVLAVLLVLPLIGGVSSRTIHAQPESVSTPLAPGVMASCELMCWEPFEACEEGEHDAFDSAMPSTWNAVRNGGAHVTQPLCRTGTCATHHGPLPCLIVELPGVDVLATIQKALISDDAPVIARLISAAPKRIVLNVSRSALQVVGCSGGIVAHMPVSADLMAKVGHILESN